MQTRIPIKKPFADIRQNGDIAKGFLKEKSKDSGIIPDARPLSTMAPSKNDGAIAQPFIFLDHEAGCRYSDHTEITIAASRRLKPAFSIHHIQKFFSVKCRVAVRPRRLLLASVTLGGFLFLGGHTMQQPLQSPTPQDLPPISTEQPKTKDDQFRAFCTWYDHPVDILNNAASIISFLEDVTPSMIDNGANLGLSKKGMNGLSIIYLTLGETIQAAIEATNSLQEARS